MKLTKDRMIIIKLTEQYKNQYISLHDIEDIKKNLKDLKSKKDKSTEEKIILKKYQKIDKIILEHNLDYLNSKREKTPCLDNINGFPLDEYQSRVVLSNEDAILVVAGAGSGKSLTIIGKIVYLVKECNISPEDILCISFTNDATINLKNNIQKNYNFNIDVYTFHKLALNILKQHKIDYQIAPDNYLQQVIDEFFDEILKNNNKLTKSLNIVLGKKYTSQDLINLKRLISTFINLFKSNDYNPKYFLIILKKIKLTLNIKESIHNKHLLLLIINIYYSYERSLSKENSLDFNDMINESISILKNKGLNKKWRYIIVDEYQDTSITKFNMIKEIINLTKANFLAVGDDFQSIYRFTGCNLHIFLNFTKYFENSKIFQIVNTYRNPQELIDVAGAFVMKNKYQQKKHLYSSKHLEKPIVIYYSENKVQALKELLCSLEQENIKEIMVLGRNNRDIEKYIDNTYTKNEDNYTYNQIAFRYLTIHKSKGLESENVILINIEDSLTGMPTKIKDEKILKYVNNTKDLYPYEEERRLFYVALTRTKKRTYIISPYKNESIFVKEIKKYDKNVRIVKR